MTIPLKCCNFKRNKILKKLLGLNLYYDQVFKQKRLYEYKCAIQSRHDKKVSVYLNAQILYATIIKLKSFGQFWWTWGNIYRAWKVDKSPQLPLLHLPFWQPARGSCKSENWRNWTPLNRVRSKVTIVKEFMDRSR